MYIFSVSVILNCEDIFFYLSKFNSSNDCPYASVILPSAVRASFRSFRNSDLKFGSLILWKQTIFMSNICIFAKFSTKYENFFGRFLGPLKTSKTLHSQDIKERCLYKKIKFRHLVNQSIKNSILDHFSGTKMAPPGGDIKFVFHRRKSKFPTLSHTKNIFCQKKLQNF